MPPQQAYGLLDFVDHSLDLGTHAAISCFAGNLNAAPTTAERFTQGNGR